MGIREGKVSVLTTQSLAKTAVKVGFLTKRGGSRNNWRRRFVVLASNKIYYFKGAEVSERMNEAIVKRGLDQVCSNHIHK